MSVAIKSKLFNLRIAMAHWPVFPIPTGIPNDSVILDKCAVCGLNIDDPIHGASNIEHQRKRKTSIVATIMLFSKRKVGN